MTQTIQFLIDCCKVNPSVANIENICRHTAQLDKPQLAEMGKLAHKQGVFALVYDAIQHHASDLTAKEILAELKHDRQNMAIQNMYMTAELIRILALLQSNNIQAMAFKGPALSELAYADSTLREYFDLDILIRKQDIRKSISILTEDQYKPELALSENARKTFFECVNVIGLTKKIRIEIHWELLSKNYAIDWKEEALWKEKHTLLMDSTQVPLLSFDTHLLYICAHGSKHLFERLEWVCDIDRLIRSKPDLSWTNLLSQAQSLGIERMLLLGIYLCHELLALPLPEVIDTKIQTDQEVEALGQHLITLHFSNSATTGRSYGTFGLLWRMRENRSDRLRFAYRALFAPKFDDFKYLQLPSQPLFLYPIIRPFRLFIKYFRGQA